MATDMMPNHESRWHRPNLYWTIPALFLLTVLIVAISLNEYYVYKNPRPGSALSFFGDLFKIAVYSLVGCLTLFSAIKLLHKRKTAVISSIIALVSFEFYFWLVSFQHWYAWWGEYGADYNTAYDLQMKSIGIPLFVLDLIMIALVIIGWKMMFKKTSSL